MEGNNTMLRLGIGLPLGLGLLMLGQAEAAIQSQAFPYSDLVFSGGAVSVLSYLAWHVIVKEMPTARKDAATDAAAARTDFTKTLDSMAERHERWETLRHEDSQKIGSALNNMAVTCAKVQSRLLEGETHDPDIQSG